MCVCVYIFGGIYLFSFERSYSISIPVQFCKFCQRKQYFANGL